MVSIFLNGFTKSLVEISHWTFILYLSVLDTLVIIKIFVFFISLTICVPCLLFLSPPRYGSTPKYVLGAVRNAELISQVFPGWVARFYIDMGSVPADIVAQVSRCGSNPRSSDRG